MTNDEMATLVALAAAATPGPWRVKPLKGKYYGTDVQIGTHGQISLWRTGGYDDPMERVPSQEECPGWTPDWRDEDGDPYCLADNHYQSQRDADTAAFIAAARDAVPALVAEVKRLRGLVKAAYLEARIRRADGPAYTAWEGSDAKRYLDGAA